MIFKSAVMQIKNWSVALQDEAKRLLTKPLSYAAILCTMKSLFHLAFKTAATGHADERWTIFFSSSFGNPMEVRGFALLDTVYTP